ncbi:MAG TPA: hypothetical protein DF712_04635 [Balneola sp.]|nr:hypothetical protein [Balneola sp.]
MAYFLGRDVNVFITTEAVNGTNASGVFVDDAGDLAVVSGSGDNTFALPLNSGMVAGNEVQNMTGVDLSIGAVDEDITYFGERSVTKAEIKKETVLTITKKKSNNVFDGVYNNGGRYGVSGSSVGNSFSDGLGQPSQQKVSTSISYGYRIHVQMKDQSETFSIPNSCIQAHTTSLNADGTTEETIEFMSYVTPLVTTGNVATAATTAANI